MKARRVLFIGGDVALTDAITRALPGSPVACERVAGGVSALLRLRRHSVAAVVTSPDTPIEEDLALVEEMRGIRPGVKTILLAPSATPEEVIAALRAHVYACFTAPFDPDEIASMLRQAFAVPDEREGIEVLSAHRNWLSLRADCRRLTAERVVHFLAELRSDLEEDEREPLLFAFREILLNAMEHGAGFDPDKMVEVTAVRTERAVVYYVRDPGPGFDMEDLPHAAVSNPPEDPVAHGERRRAEGLRPGGFGLLLASRIVDELIQSERGNEVLLIKHTV